MALAPILSRLAGSAAAWLRGGGAPIVAALVAVAVSLVATGGAWLTARIESQRNTQLTQRLTATQTSLEGARLGLAQVTHLRAAADRANAQVADLLITNERLKQEAAHALANVTTGRACLGAAAVRVLNRAPGLTVAAVPGAAAPAGGADAAAATAAADPIDAQDEAIVTDTAIGQWAIQAGALYEAARARHAGLTDYARAVSGQEPAP
ncbi:MAG: hypothetical protein LCH73_02860 [Proteobacteria bacterium]|nr:hypothetical protein [Pseudomonadota bacterium]